MSKLDKGYVKRLHVNQNLIKSNAKHGTNHPVITIQTSDGPMPAHRAKIDGPSEFITSFDKPLSCGARVWIETKSAVEIIE